MLFTALLRKSGVLANESATISPENRFFNRPAQAETLAPVVITSSTITMHEASPSFLKVASSISNK